MGGNCKAELISSKGFFDDARLQGTLSYSLKNLYLRCAELSAMVSYTRHGLVLSPSGREFFNHQARTLANSCDMRGVSHALFPLPQGEGQGEGSPDKYHMNLTKRKLDGVKYGERVRSTIASLSVTRSVEKMQSQTAENGSVFSCLVVRVKRRCTFRLRGTFQPRLTIRFLSSVSFLLHRDKRKETDNNNTDCFALLAKMNNRRQLAFTLAEVLIVLGIIGLIADMTIPTLHQNITEKVTTAQLKKAYSSFSQMYLTSIAENGTPDTWVVNNLNWTPENANAFMDIFKKYLKITKDCGCDYSGNTHCWPDALYSLHGPFYQNLNLQPSGYYKAQLADGSLIALEVTPSTCNKDVNSCATMRIDVNGMKPPNTMGKDTFFFTLGYNKVIPAGKLEGEFSYPATGSSCNYKTGLQWNGMGCAAWVVYNENMDYLHCDDLEWGKKTKCSN